MTGRFWFEKITVFFRFLMIDIDLCRILISDALRVPAIIVKTMDTMRV